MLTKTQALKSLPDTVHLAAYNLYVMRGKNAAAEYLKHEICKRNPSVRFTSDRPTPLRQHLEGISVDFEINGLKVLAMKTNNGKIWVARAPMLRAAGFGRDPIARLSPKGVLGMQLKAKGFSFNSHKGHIAGHARSGMYFITPRNARIALEVLTSAKANCAA